MSSGDLTRLPRSGTDLAALLERVDTLLNEAGASDRAALFETATKALASPVTGWPPMPLLLLDVPFESEIEAQFLWALVQQSPHVMITVPAGDASALSQLKKRDVRIQLIEEAEHNDLTRLAHYLFSKEPPPERARTGELVWFSAPGEGRECVEIARRILKEAERGVRFDEMAIVIRSPQQYVGVLGARAGPGGDPRVLRSWHPASASSRPRIPGDAQLRGREFLRQTLRRISFARPGALAGRCRQGFDRIRPFDLGGVARRGLRRSLRAAADETEDRDRQRRPPIRCQRERRRSCSGRHAQSAVEMGKLARRIRRHRRQRTLGAAAGWSGGAVSAADPRADIEDEPDSSRIPHFERELQNLEHLRAFALPLIEDDVCVARRGDLGRLASAPRSIRAARLRRPEHVLRVLADLRPMAAVGPVALAEVRDVLADRLVSLEVEPPAHRYGRVFVGSPHQARGRVFKVVSCRAWQSGCFRRSCARIRCCSTICGSELSGGADPARAIARSVERLLLRLAVGAATERLYVVVPAHRIVRSPRARAVVLRARNHARGHRPGSRPSDARAHGRARSEGEPRVAGAGRCREDAIDDFEHDLSVLRAADAQRRAMSKAARTTCSR